MKMKCFKTCLMLFFFLAFCISAQSQSLSGTTWNVTIPSISTKHYNFIFNATSKKGNVLYPDNTLADFSWTEDGKGNWSITIERMINGVKKTEFLNGKITGNTGTGFYSNSADKKNLKPLTMTKKQ